MNINEAKEIIIEHGNYAKNGKAILGKTLQDLSLLQANSSYMTDYTTETICLIAKNVIEDSEYEYERVFPTPDILHSIEQSKQIVIDSGSRCINGKTELGNSLVNVNVLPSNFYDLYNIEEIMTQASDYIIESLPFEGIELTEKYYTRETANGNYVVNNSFTKIIQIKGTTEKVITETYQKANIQGYSEVVKSENIFASNEEVIDISFSNFYTRIIFLKDVGIDEFKTKTSYSLTFQYYISSIEFGDGTTTQILTNIAGISDNGYLADIKSGTPFTPVLDAWQTVTLTFTTNQHWKNLQWRVLKTQSTSSHTTLVGKIRNVCFKENTSDTTYKPYFEPYIKSGGFQNLDDNKYHIITNDNQDIAINDSLKGLSTSQDEIISNLGVRRRYGQIVFDGSDDETITLSNYWSGQGYQMFNIGLVGAFDPNIASILCNRLTTITYASVTQHLEETYFCFKNSATLMCVYLDNTYTLDTFKQWLSQNPITIIYELATPTLEFFENPYKLSGTITATDYYKSMVVTNQEEVNDSVLYNAMFNGIDSQSKDGKLTSRLELPLGEIGQWDGLYEATNLLQIADVNETTLNGITYSIKNGIVTLNGTATANFGQWIPVTNIPKNTQSTLSLFSQNYIGWNNPQLWLCKEKNDYANRIMGNNTASVSVNVAYDINYVLIYVISGTTLTNCVLKPMLVSGSVAPTMYLPYVDSPYVDVEGGAKIVLDGTENWGKSNNFFFIPQYLKSSAKLPTDNNTIASCLCDKLNVVARYSITGGDMNIAISIDGTICIYIASITSVEDLKIWLDKNNVALIYQLATPTYTSISTSGQYQVWRNGLEKVDNINHEYANAEITQDYIAYATQGE